MTHTLTRHRFTVREYARMREAGIFTEDDRVELLDGEIFVMRPIGPLHVGIVNKLNKILSRQVGDAAIVSVQNPIQLNDYAEPQPDIALLAPQDDFYTSALATPDDVFLVIEIADTSLEYDREQKLPRYAAAGISEVWIVAVNQQMIEQYTTPVQSTYTHMHTILAGHAIQATQLSAVHFTTDQLFS